LDMKTKVSTVKIASSNDAKTQYNGISNKRIENSHDEVDKSQDFDIKLNSNGEKSLLEEINETLLSKKILVNETASAKSSILIKGKDAVPKNDVIKVSFVAKKPSNFFQIFPAFLMPLFYLIKFEVWLTVTFGDLPNFS